jgi:hypothetical protein
MMSQKTDWKSSEIFKKTQTHRAVFPNLSSLEPFDPLGFLQGF